MGLQVRVRHALGERLVDLEDRSADNPLLIGRSKDADVKIPSVAVASRHGAMFLHDGRWVVQDLSKGATYLNGNPMQGPTPLSVGDVLTLGNDTSPATIEIDPAGAAAGQKGEPALTSEPAPAPPPRNNPSPRVSPAAPRRMQPTPAYAAPRAMPPQIARPAPALVSNDPWGQEATATDDPFAGWQQSSSTPTSTGDAATPRRRRHKQMSPVALILGILVCILIVAGTIWAVYTETHHEPPPVKVVTPPSERPRGTGNIFTGKDTPDPSPAPAKPSKSKNDASTLTPAKSPGVEDPRFASAMPPVAPSNGTPTPDTPATTEEGKKAEKELEEVEGATYSPEIGQAILKFDDYRRQHPGMNAAKLDEWTDQAMDRLWWKRIMQLCTHRDEKNKAIRAKDKELREQPEGAFKKTLMDERKVLQDDLDRTQEHLASDMGYTNSDTPDQDNKDMMARLTTERDASKFGAWRISTLKYIRNNHGSTPWDGEN